MSKYIVLTTERELTVHNVTSVDVQGGAIVFRDNYDNVLFMIGDKYFVYAEKVLDGANT